ncbi:OmpA family protein [Sphingobacterium yanglingense]|uniref:Outer membrane protein OmpA-like peptidoglycan-associated protein n=1 Tax=Sphingobacterium yanglingense TaxID=1437280 RepID=A0A4R6WND5_9SPHI|nr:OmpA family protein [Sphingobacterium yanglingense]TDQ79621.1 outer membrane protein OmpA-like peptidoglycan-associated protein [Sphingobacterium yanglingense]
MENNILQNIQSYFTEEVIDKLANHLGEDREKVAKGVNIAVPSLLLGLQSQSKEGLTSIFQSAKHLFASFDLHDALGKYFAKDDKGESAHFESDNIASEIFGDKFMGITQSIGKYLGMSSESVNSLFGASIPAVISGITKKGGHWDVAEVGQLLQTNRSSFASAIPAGLGLGMFGSLFAKADVAKELGGPDSSQPATAIPEPAIVHTKQRADKAKKGAGIWWILILVLIAALWFLFGKGCNGDKTTNPEKANTSLDSNQNTKPDSSAKNHLVDVKLPDGNSLQAFSSGIEDQLVQFLQSDYKTWTDEQLKAKWFDFDNLNFETNTATVTPASQVQLVNIARILRLFPDAKIKIGGYTDKTGDEAINKKVSQERADAVKNYLEKEGLGTQVVGAEGYGSEFAQAAWDAPDKERAKDRRVAISVRK